MAKRRRTTHLNDVTGSDADVFGMYTAYFPRADLHAYNIDHTTPLIEYLKSIGFDCGEMTASGVYHGAVTVRYEFFNACMPDACIIVTDYTRERRVSGSEYTGFNNWAHIKVKGNGELAVTIRRYIDSYNTSLDGMTQYTCEVEQAIAH